jgi:hypothetical protein
VEALRPKLTQEQTQAALGPALDALRQSTDGYQIQALAQAVQTLGPTRDQTQVALVHVLDAVRGTTDPYQLQALELAVQALGPTPEQAQDALNPILGTMCQTTDPEGVQPLPSYQIKALGQPIQVLGPLLTPEQTLADLDVVLFAIS